MFHVFQLESASETTSKSNVDIQYMLFVVCGNSIPNTHTVEELTHASIVKFNHHWLLSDEPLDDSKYTVVVHDSSIVRTMIELKKRNLFNCLEQIVVCCSLDSHSARNYKTVIHLRQYARQLKHVKIQFLTEGNLETVYNALTDRGFSRCSKPRTGLVYVMWLVLQNNTVYLNGFDIENTDLLTHQFEPTIDVSHVHNPTAEGYVLKSLIADRLVSVLKCT